MDRATVEQIRQRAELCAEATLPGQQLRDLCDYALADNSVEKLCAHIKDSIRLCDHGYIHITCGQCVAPWMR